MIISRWSNDQVDSVALEQQVAINMKFVDTT
jgi:hypothetical protein